MKENEVITDIELLNLDWLTKILKKKGHLSQGKVVKIIKKKSLEDYASNIHFLEVDFSTDAQTEPACSEIVVKIRKNINSRKCNHEVDFYNLVAEDMNKIPIPVCWNDC